MQTKHEANASEAKKSKCSTAQQKPKKVSGDNGEEDPPVPIPNTEVKLFRVESTWLVTAREDRSSPDSKRKALDENRVLFSFYQDL